MLPGDVPDPLYNKPEGTKVNLGSILDLMTIII